MRAITIGKDRTASALKLGEVPEPVPRPNELLLRVAATAVNRADVLQRQGYYSPPEGASEILGLECAGTVAAMGAHVQGWSVGDRVLALLTGGGYAEYATVDAGSALRLPQRLDIVEAAAIPEVFLTVYLNLFELGQLAPGQRVLVHGGGSGVGTAAIQLVREAEASCFVTAGSESKCARCRELGAELAINYRDQSFAAAVREASEGRGVDIILDSIGAAYLRDNLDSLARGGRLIVIGAMRGTAAEIDLAQLLRRHLTLLGSTLRSRPAAEKADLLLSFSARFGYAINSGQVRPVIDRVLPLEEAAEAHRVMEAGEHFGKIVLRVD